MDRNRFGEKSTGEVVRITFPRRDWAFIPSLVPPAWEFATDLWPLLKDAAEQLGTLNGIGQLLPDPELLLRPLQSREAITSSSMEGTFVTPEQLLMYELDPREPSSAEGKKADWFEVFNYSRALNSGRESLKTGSVTNHLIREMHATLMHGVRGRDKAPGQFREKQVQIGSNARYVPPPPHEVPRLMDNLAQYINDGDDPVDPLVKCFLVHYQFEAIHPFEDGNGRVGRALLALMVHKCCGHSHPWLYLSPYFEKYKDEYTQSMFRISTNGEWHTWIELCLRGVIQQSRDAIRRCHLFRKCRERFHEMLNSPSPRSHAIIEGLFSNPLVTIVSIAERHGTAYHTARKDLERLSEAGILFELDDSRPKAYFANMVMSIAYHEDIDTIEGLCEAFCEGKLSFPPS